ncbi:MAG: hypothetical protein ACL93V_04925 [Candidatus Electrothrix sp. YB6]
MNMNRKTALKISAAVFFICTVWSSTSFAADKKHELIMLEAAKNVEFLSQKIAKAYFYKQQGVRPDRAAEDLKKSVTILQKDLIIIQDGIDRKNKEEGNIAVFLDYTYNELNGMLNKPYSRENGALIIDYSESLLEGAEFIAQQHMHKESPEEAMLIMVEHMLFLLERINKLYIAYQAEFKDYNNVTQLKQAVQDFDAALSKINAYTKYSAGAQKSRDKINEFWPVAQEFFVDLQKAALPVIVLASVEKLEKQLENLDDFHHKAASR